MLTQQSHVLRKVEGDKDYVEYVPADEDDPERWLPDYFQRREDWIEMGEPGIITITVKPGDHLNPPPQPDPQL